MEITGTSGGIPLLKLPEGRKFFGRVKFLFPNSLIFTFMIHSQKSFNKIKTYSHMVVYD
jgi:hypothetical protein